jgi:uncharacterized membrane protein (UPF0127 family)
VRKGFLLFLILFASAAFFIWSAAYRQTALPDMRRSDNAVVCIGGAEIKAELADSPLERMKGLSQRPSLPDNAGMLFVFEQSDFHGIWMKDMLFPTDIIWIDENMQVVDMKANTEPESYPEVFKPSVKAKYVLEVHAGYTKENSIAIGDAVLFK